MQFNFVVDGKPKGKARPRLGKFGVYTPRTTADYEKLIALQCRQAMRKAGCEISNCPVVLSVSIFNSYPTRWKKAYRQAAESLEAQHSKILAPAKPDVDNVLKCVLDALNGVAYRDDQQVILCQGRKFYSEAPRIEIAVTYLGCAGYHYEALPMPGVGGDIAIIGHTL